MIIAEFNSQNNMVRFSDPYENFTSDQATAHAWSIAEVKRMVYFKNRAYIYQTLKSWLLQRAHALPTNDAQGVIAEKIYELETKKGSYYSLCSYVQKNSSTLKRIAPGTKSRFYKHYKTVILPLLNDCIIQAQ